jgi:transposase/very-short-patch-repair endonuclease
MDIPLLDVPPDPEAKPRPKPICGGKRFRVVPDRRQMWLVDHCVDDLVNKRSKVRVWSDIVDRLDVSPLEAQYSGGGAPAYPPRFVVKILLFAMDQGVRSAYEISERCEYDRRFIWLAHGLQVDHEVFSDFRRRFAGEIAELFKQSVLLGLKARVITLQQVSIDGTKIAAHGRRGALTAEDIRKLMALLDQRCKELQAELAELDRAEAQDGPRSSDQIDEALADAEHRRERLLKAQQQLEQQGWQHVCENDLEATLQKTQDGTRPGYNCQAVVDNASRMVVGLKVTDAQNDTEQFADMLNEVERTAGRLPDEAVADHGYHSQAALQAAEDSPVNCFIKQKRGRGNPGFHRDDFGYDAERDVFICPAGQLLLRSGYKTIGKRRRPVYAAAPAACAACPFKQQCTGGNKAGRRQLLVPEHHVQSAKMRQKLDTPAGQRAVRTRACTIEPTFGTIKSVFGLRQFLLCGKQGAQIEFHLAALTLNLRKLTNWAMTQGELSLLVAAAAS